jgi:hypothetical protein
MDFRRLIDITPPTASSRQPGTPARPAGDTSIGVFLTPQSFVTFPVASVVVSVAWKVLASIFPAWGTSRITLLVIALIVGALLYALSTSAKTTLRERFIAAGVALFNSFFLAASALGIESVS